MPKKSISIQIYQKLLSPIWNWISWIIYKIQALIQALLLNDVVQGKGPSHLKMILT